MMEANNQKGMSKNKRFFSIVRPIFPANIAPNGKDNIGSVMFDPINVPREMSEAFFVIALMAVESSGKPVPTPIIKTPIKDCEMPQVSDIFNALFTTKLDA